LEPERHSGLVQLAQAMGLGRRRVAVPMGPARVPEKAMVLA